MDKLRVTDERTVEMIHELVDAVGGDAESFEGRLLADMIQASLKMIPDGHDTGQLKLVANALKEMRYAYRVFNRYRGTRKIAIFGSARTPEDHPDYHAAKAFGTEIARHEWMAITGAGDGIMKAGHEGPKRSASFGLSIRLPFETTANEVIEGDPKLVNFRYFFTRKLMFMSHADAVAVFPGGFGTQDELFETLTLVQTGKSNLVPVVLLEGEGGEYWTHWDRYVRKNLQGNGWVSPEDTGIYKVAGSVDEAVEHILRFYRVYHSSRYVRDELVFRLRQPLTAEQVDILNDEFAVLVRSGRIEASGPLGAETDHLELPRLVFEHTRKDFALLLALIDRINGFASAPAKPLDCEDARR